jgi:hypothetical protein
LKDGFARLDPEHKLFKQLAEQPPLWWKNICNNKKLYIDVRKDNTLDVYFNGGKIINLKYTDSYQGSIHFKYIPLTSRAEYVPFRISNDRIEIITDELAFADINNFDPDAVASIQNSISKYFSSASEKGIQAQFVLAHNSSFIDTEFQYTSEDKGKRFDLIWVDINTRKLFVVELKSVKNPELNFDEQSRNSKSYKKIDSQLTSYKSFIKENKRNMEKYYQKVFHIKKKLGILPEGLRIENSLEGFTFEEQPILLIGDCTQAWIKDNSARLDAALTNIAFACFYQGKETRNFHIPEKTQGNRHILPLT